MNTDVGTVSAVPAACRVGMAAAIGFIPIYAVITSEPPPVTLLSATRRVLYGPLQGGLVIWCGALLGATTAFPLGQVISHEEAERLFQGRVDRPNALLTARGHGDCDAQFIGSDLRRSLVKYASAATTVALRQLPRRHRYRSHAGYCCLRRYRWHHPRSDLAGVHYGGDVFVALTVGRVAGARRNKRINLLVAIQTGP